MGIPEGAQSDSLGPPCRPCPHSMAYSVGYLRILLECMEQKIDTNLNPAAYVPIHSHHDFLRIATFSVQDQKWLVGCLIKLAPLW